MKTLVTGKTLLTVLVLSATIGMIFNVQGDQALAKSQPSTDPPTTVTTNPTTNQNFLSVPVDTTAARGNITDVR